MSINLHSYDQDNINGNGSDDALPYPPGAECAVCGEPFIIDGLRHPSRATCGHAFTPRATDAYMQRTCWCGTTYGDHARAGHVFRDMTERDAYGGGVR